MSLEKRSRTRILQNYPEGCGLVQARLVQDMQKLSPDHFDWATSIVLGRYPGAVQVPHLIQH